MTLAIKSLGLIEVICDNPYIMYVSLPRGGTMLVLNIDDLTKVNKHSQSAHNPELIPKA